MVTFDYPGDEQWLCLNCLEEGESFFTQDERARPGWGLRYRNRTGGNGSRPPGGAGLELGWLHVHVSAVSRGVPGGAPPKTMAVPADRQEPVVLEHESGARIEILPGATAGALGEDGAETVTVTIQEVEPPAGMGE